MYGKIFESIYEGSLYGQWEAIVTMQQLIVICDPDGNVDMTPQAISGKTSIPFDIIKKGLDVLSELDPYTRTPGEEGRRITLIDDHKPWGWHLVNHEKYKRLVDIETVREQTRERVRKHRVLQGVTVTDGNGCVTDGNACNGIQTQTQIQKESCPRKKFSDSDLLTAKWMYQQIQKMNPNHKPPNFETWAKEIRLLRERDKRTDTEIRQLFGWANSDKFWRTNILSPSTLRKQWDRLIIQRGENGRPDPFKGAQ